MEAAKLLFGNFFCGKLHENIKAIRQNLLVWLDARAPGCESSVLAFPLPLSAKSSNDFDYSC